MVPGNRGSGVRAFWALGFTRVLPTACRTRLRFARWGLVRPNRLTNDQCDANLRRSQENERSRLSSYNVVPVDPDFLTVAPCPMSRPPDVIAPAHIITRAASIIGSIANLDRDGAWVGAIARVTSVPGSVWAITRVTASITTPIIRSVTRARAAVILVFASA